MATATRRKPTKKKTAKKVEKKTEKKASTKKVEKKVEETPTTLDSEHLRELEVRQRDVRIAQLTMATEEQYLNNLNLSLEVLNNKIEKQKSVVQDRSNKYNAAKESYSKYKESIWPIYGLKKDQPMGFDPSTGEIKS